MKVKRVNLTNWVLGTPPKFTTGVKYQFIKVSDQISDPEIPITLPPNLLVIGAFYVTHDTRATTSRGRELTLDHKYFFDHTRA